MRYFLTCLLLALFPTLPLHAATREKPHIILILVDDLGYGDPGCYNPDSKIHTPHIDRLATEGLRFTDMHASGPLCHVSRYGLMTGRYPFRTEVNKWPTQAVITPNQVTVPSLLRDRGYQTAMVGKWHLGFDENGYDQPLPGGPIDRGFDTYFGLRASTDIPPYFYIRQDRAVQPPTDSIADHSTDGWSPIQGEFWRAGGIAPDLKLPDVLPRFTDEALSVLHQHHTDASGNPLFLYLAYPAPHTPWLPSGHFQGKSGAGMYGDFVQMVDSEIGRILAAVDEAGIAENTLVLFTSDNGPVWYEADVQRFGHDATHPLRGMKSDAWEAGHRMPFLARWPGQVPASTTTAQTLSFVDLLATLAALTGAPLEAGAGPDSFDFSTILLGVQPEDQPIRTSLALQSGGGAMTLRMGDWKYIDRLGSAGFSDPKKITPTPGGPTVQLYNLATDPGETTNLAPQHPEKVTELRAELDRVVTAPSSR